MNLKVGLLNLEKEEEQPPAHENVPKLELKRAKKNLEYFKGKIIYNI